MSATNNKKQIIILVALVFILIGIGYYLLDEQGDAEQDSNTATISTSNKITLQSRAEPPAPLDINVTIGSYGKNNKTEEVIVPAIKGAKTQEIDAIFESFSTSTKDGAQRPGVHSRSDNMGVPPPLSNGASARPIYNRDQGRIQQNDPSGFFQQGDRRAGGSVQICENGKCYLLQAK